MTERADRTAETCHAAGCTRPVEHGAFVCPTCMAEHDERMADLPLLAHALEDRFLKQQRFSVASIGLPPLDEDGAPSESPVMFDSRAGDVRRKMTRLLVRWTRHYDVRDPLGYPSRLDYHRLHPTAEAMVDHLRRHADLIAPSVLGPQCVDDFRAIHGKALRAVDRPPDLVYLGICSMPVKADGPDGPTTECDVDLYAEWGKAHARCSGCKHHHDVKNRQTVLLAHVRDQLATASDISRGLSGLDIVVKPERIRKWKQRKRLTAHGATLRDEPLYRVGDVIDLVMTERERIRSELRKANT